MDKRIPCLELQRSKRFFSSGRLLSTRREIKFVWINFAEEGIGMSSVIGKIFGRIFPKPEDGNACHEAAFDPDLMPKAIRDKLEQEQSKEQEEAEKAAKK